MIVLTLEDMSKTIHWAAGAKFLNYFLFLSLTILISIFAFLFYTYYFNIVVHMFNLEIAICWKIHAKHFLIKEQIISLKTLSLSGTMLSI